MRQRNLIYLTFIIAIAILIGYGYVYRANPFSDELNNILIYAADPFVTLLAALSVTAVLSCYQKDDKPYRVWLCFTIGIWFWVVAETIYSVIAYQLSDGVPPPGWADVCWFIGYGLVSFALYYQSQLIYKIKNGLLKFGLIWIGLLLLVPLILWLLRSELSTENFIGYLYPVVDLAIFVFALRLFMVFGGGKLSRPWIGLLLMGISDAIWAWVNLSGGDNADTFVGDIVYVAAYLILALGFFRQYLLLKFGPEE